MLGSAFLTPTQCIWKVFCFKNLKNSRINGKVERKVGRWKEDEWKLAWILEYFKLKSVTRFFGLWGAFASYETNELKVTDLMDIFVRVFEFEPSPKGKIKVTTRPLVTYFMINRQPPHMTLIFCWLFRLTMIDGSSKVHFKIPPTSSKPPTLSSPEHFSRKSNSNPFKSAPIELLSCKTNFVLYFLI